MVGESLGRCQQESASVMLYDENLRCLLIFKATTEVVTRPNATAAVAQHLSGYAKVKRLQTRYRYANILLAEPTMVDSFVEVHCEH